MSEKKIAPNPASLLESDDYKRGWYDGYHAAKKEQRNDEFPTVPPPMPSTNKYSGICSVCGMDFTKSIFGYVCPNYNCPIKVTCTY